MSAHLSCCLGGTLFKTTAEALSFFDCVRGQKLPQKCFPMFQVTLIFLSLNQHMGLFSPPQEKQSK